MDWPPHLFFIMRKVPAAATPIPATAAAAIPSMLLPPSLEAFPLADLGVQELEVPAAGLIFLSKSEVVTNFQAMP